MIFPFHKGSDTESWPNLNPLFRGRRKRRRGFTMIEIAVSLAVLGFALVAVIGVLPNGLTVQKDNREKTIINEDARLIMEALREGNQGLYALTNHVEAIFVVLTNRAARLTNIYYFNDNPVPASLAKWAGNIVKPGISTNNPIFDLAALTSPRGAAFAPNEYFFRSMALMRSMSGTFTEQSEARPGNISDLSFHYLLTVEVTPYNGFLYSDVAAANSAPRTPEVVQAQNRARQLWVLTNELHEARLLFQWPVLPGGKVGNNRQSYRTLISGVPRAINFTNNPAGQFFYFQSQKYQLLF